MNNDEKLQRALDYIVEQAWFEREEAIRRYGVDGLRADAIERLRKDKAKEK